NVRPKLGKLKVVPAVEKTVNGQPLLITSFVPKETVVPGYEVVDPMPALKALLGAPRPANTIVIVIAEERHEDRRAMAQQLPAVNLWFGASPNEAAAVIDEQHDEGLLFLSPATLGRSVARVLLEPTARGGKARPTFTSPIYIENAKMALDRPAG